MSIRSFYPNRYFDKKISKTLLIVLSIFWVIFLPYYAFIVRSSWFFMVVWLLFGTHQLVGILYSLKTGHYLEKGEKNVKPKSIPPEEFLAKAKNEAKSGKK